MAGEPRRPSEGPPGPRPPRRPSRLTMVGAVVAGIATLVALLGFGLTRDPTELRSPLIGRPAPEFRLRSLDGADTVALADLRGQVVVVNFWASWCTECRIEHPALAEAWRRYRDKGVVLIGIPFHDTPSDSRAYLEEEGGDWPVLHDPGSATALDFGVYGVPETYFIGPDGRIAGRHIGPVTYEQLSEQITELLPGRSA